MNKGENVANTIKGDDEVIVEEGTMYNEWLAAQGLIDLKSYQPSSGSIRKLHETKGSKDNVKQVGESSPKDDVSVSESSKVELVELDKISPVKEQDIVTSPIKSKEYVKRQAFVRRKLNIRKAQKVLLNKCNTKIVQKAKSKCVPKLKESGEENKQTVVESKKPDK